MQSKKKIILIFLLVILFGVAFYPTPEIGPIRYVERPTGGVRTEKVAGENLLAWLYHNPAGQLTLRALVKRKFISTWYGNRMDAPR